MSFNDVYNSDEDDDDDDDDDDENSRGTNNSTGSGQKEKKKKKTSKGGGLGALNKAWDDIIPSALREKMEEEERQQVRRGEKEATAERLVWTALRWIGVSLWDNSITSDENRRGLADTLIDHPAITFLRHC